MVMPTNRERTKLDLKIDGPSWMTVHVADIYVCFNQSWSTTVLHGILTFV